MRSENWSAALVWLGKDRGWQRASERNCLPGATIMFPTDANGYASDRGWTGDKRNASVTPAYEIPRTPTDEDMLSILADGWRSIEEHTQMEVPSNLYPRRLLGTLYAHRLKKDDVLQNGIAVLTHLPPYSSGPTEKERRLGFFFEVSFDFPGQLESTSPRPLVPLPPWPVCSWLQ